jgi:2-polyprenyl-6-methoxyphenol hydroxylase-like FAD-dependent oxidoreductase
MQRNRVTMPEDTARPSGAPSFGDAVVLGAGISGLLAAHTLALFCSSVILVDRDTLPSSPVTRRGVPQGQHTHVLMPRGSQLLEEMFPGFLAELTAAGAPAWTDGDLSKLRMSLGGTVMTRRGRLRDPAALAQYYASRPLVEHTVRRRVTANSNVTVLDGHELLDIVEDRLHHRVTGVRIVHRDTGEVSSLDAAVVVDATGRGSRTPAHLDAFGYGPPPVDEVQIDLQYATQRIRFAASGEFDDMMVGYPQTADSTGGFALVGVEDETWYLTAFAMGRATMPSTHADFLTFLEPVAPPDVLAAIRHAEPLDKVIKYRVPSNRWRRYDKLRCTPAGLLVVGDAFCSFNPVYGQGMTVAALQADALSQCLRGGDEELARRYFRAAAKKISLAWQTAVKSDVSVQRLPGGRSMGKRLSEAYLQRVLSAAGTDPAMAEIFLRVIGMVDSPARLVRPSALVRAATAGRR